MRKSVQEMETAVDNIIAGTCAGLVILTLIILFILFIEMTVGFLVSISIGW